MKCRYFCRLPLDISPVYLTRGISVFLLKYFYFESNIAIAERCGFTERKVTHMLAHTRAQLKEYLIKEEIYL